MKKWLIIFVIFLCGSLAWCEKLPEVGYTKDFNQQDNPIIYAYMKDYVDQLYNAFDARKFGRKQLGTTYTYTIHKDGSISNLKKVLPENDTFDKYIQNIITNNPPTPFPSGMEVEQVNMRTFLCKDKYKEIDFEYYPHRPGFRIMITKDYRKGK